MTDPTLVQLTLAFPPPVERPLLELLFEFDPGLGGFSSVAAAGHGHGFEHASIQELVRGHADRRQCEPLPNDCWKRSAAACRRPASLGGSVQC